jgi:hypothetical protein
VPDRGLGDRLNRIQEWLDQNAGADGWAMTPIGMRGVMNDAISIHLADATIARMEGVYFDKAKRRYFIERRTPTAVRAIIGGPAKRYHKFRQAVDPVTANLLAGEIIRGWEAEWNAALPQPQHYDPSWDFTFGTRLSQAHGRARGGGVAAAFPDGQRARPGRARPEAGRCLGGRAVRQGG